MRSAPFGGGKLINPQDFSTEIAKMSIRNEYGNTGTVDSSGLAELGWNDNDINWLQKVCWWDEEDNDKWKVTDANKAFGPNGATPITWNNYTSYRNNRDLVYFPKMETLKSGSHTYLFNDFKYLYAIPTDGWFVNNTFNGVAIFSNSNIYSAGDPSQFKFIEGTSAQTLFMYDMNLRLDVDTTNWGIFDNMIYVFYDIRTVNKLHGLDVCFNGNDFLGILPMSAHINSIDLPTIPSDATNLGSFNGTVIRKIRRSGLISKSLQFGSSSGLSRESCLVLFNALDTDNPGTITLHGWVKAKLSDADKQIATDKGWTIA